MSLTDLKSARHSLALATASFAGGIEAGAVTIEAFGETQLAVPPDDDARAPAMRRVEINAAS